MTDTTDNREYNIPLEGDSNWHEPVNENWRALDDDIHQLYQNLNNGTTVQPGDSDDLKATVENASPGETIHVPPGTYDVPSIAGDENGEMAWITVPNDDVEIVGTGRQTVINDDNVYSDNVQNNERTSFYVNGVTGCTIRNMRFEGTYDGSSDTNCSGEHIIVRNDANGTTIDSVEFHGGRSAVNIDSSNYCRYTNWRHEDGEHAFECGGKTANGIPQQLTIENGTSRSVDYTVQRGISISSVDGMAMSNVELIEIGSTGVRFASDNGRIKDVKLTNVTVRSPTTDPFGFWFKIDTNPIEDVRFSNCTARIMNNAALSARFESDELTSGIRFTDCLFEADDAPTWWTSNQPSDNTETSWTFENCTFRTGVNGNGSRDGFRPEYLNKTVLRDCTFDGSGTDLVVDSTMTDTMVICPHLENGTFTDNGTGTFRDDMS